jgi:GTP-binding protein
MKTILAIVGRPNVGKSTLFNRIVGYRKAITEDSPGVTRDRNYGEFEYNGRDFVLIDTGGFEPSAQEGFLPLIRQQVETSIEESAILLFMLDGQSGMLPQDMEIARQLHRSGKRLFYVVNKMESANLEHFSAEFYQLGADRIYPVSALHGLGIGELLEDICKEREETGEFDVAEKKMTGGRRTSRRGRSRQADKGEGMEEVEPQPLRIAIVGRPNTGKSSLTNRILGSERMIVSDVAGTTRDAVDSVLVFKNQQIVLVDTAGLRKKSRISAKVEEYSVSGAVKSIEQADVVNLIIDAAEGASHQDAAIAHLIISRGKGLCIVVNKWDLLGRNTRELQYRELVQERIPHATYAPIIFTSATTGRHVEKILDTDLKIFGQLQRRISTAKLNAVFSEFFHKLTIGYQKGREVKVFYVNQVKTSPPTFVLFTNYPEAVPEHYKRYLENSLRGKYGFQGAPVRLVFRKKQ